MFPAPERGIAAMLTRRVDDFLEEKKQQTNKQTNKENKYISSSTHMNTDSTSNRRESWLKQSDEILYNQAAADLVVLWCWLFLATEVIWKGEEFKYLIYVLCGSPQWAYILTHTPQFNMHTCHYI